MARRRSSRSAACRGWRRRSWIGTPPATFGDLCEEDRAANTEALRSGARLLGVYEVAGLRLWIVTEADRSATTIMLPEEY
ncbi:MAG: hypothetical protein WBM40_22700 [Thiohalocapsa sp.]